LLGNTIFLVITELDLCDAHVLRFILHEACRIILVSKRTLFVKVCDVLITLQLAPFMYHTAVCYCVLFLFRLWSLCECGVWMVKVCIGKGDLIIIG
jgi:hypothetical protein